MAKLLPPALAVVKAFQYTFAGTLGRPGGGPAAGVLCRDDAEAKQVVAGLIADGGLRLDVVRWCALASWKH